MSDLPVDGAAAVFQSSAELRSRDEQTASELAMSLLAAGIPLTLLVDLATLTPAVSLEIVRQEPADTSWVQPRLSA